ncbi:hypothetical protein KR093_000692 [Drosophila rubida]|uniref:HTH OST-type domain-containing protein n=1 Tax=Drosophila rubida TaxID=30044 RepID=A0AAD4JZC1_9MUSC|nr:hypothetical protein KR093_000692 [Drosophila rubida]
MEEQGMLSYVKKVIHSLIVSTPLPMTLEQLKRDYIREEGTVIPFIKLGFKDLESFLRSIPDAVIVIGGGPMAQVQAKKNERTAHIQNLVQCQKKPRGAKAHNIMSFRYPTQRSDLVFVNEKSNQSRQFNNNSHRRRGGYRPAASNNYRNQSSRQVHQRSSEVNQTSSMTSSFSKFTIANVDESSDELNPDYVADMKHVNKKEDVKPNKPVLLDKKPKSTYHTEYLSSDEGSDEDAIPEYAVDEQVLSYKYSKNIKHSKVINVKHEIKTELIESKKEPIVSSDDGSDEEAIPAYAVDESVLGVEYPKNAVNLSYQLPVRDINKKIKLDDRIQVQLVTVASPHSFYFWIHDEEYETYKAMCNNMQRYYQRVDEKRYTIPLFLIMPGHLAAIHSRGVLWQRVRVLNSKTGSRKNIEVEYIDTGERMWICHSDLKYLCKDFAKLPAQCFYGKLARIMPRQGAYFSIDASNYFYDLVSYRRLFAKVEKINKADNAVHMILVDPDAKSNIVNINMTLIETGWVRRSYNP